MELNLLEKKELWIQNVKLKNANLNRIADVASNVLNLPREEVFVVDVRDDHITLDIMTKTIDGEDIIGKEKKLINELSKIEGFMISENTEIHSSGVLGLVSLDKQYKNEVVENSDRMVDEIREKIKKRAIVFPTGFEVKNNMIEDTNTPYIAKELKKSGFVVKRGEVIDDDLDLIAGKLRRATMEGYGLIITTGGVGAEDKDKTVEAIEKIDKNTIAPYIINFQKGTGRHEKHGVRIGVSKIGQTLIVALPGPNDEVRLGIKVLLESLDKGLNKEEIAKNIEIALKEKLFKKYRKNSNDN
jgi:molybdenum cofactor synthesis domain-containing protein